MKIKKRLKVALSKGVVAAGLIKKRNTNNPGLIVLMYHRVNNSPDCLGLTVTPELFTRQMDHLINNYKVVTLDKAIVLLSAVELKETLCAITFDDGYRDNYDIAYPVLKEKGLPATIFITCDAIKRGVFGWQPFDQAILTTSSTSLDLSTFDLGCHNLATRVQREDVISLLHQQLKRHTDTTKQLVIQHVVNNYSVQRSPERTMMNWKEVKELSDSGLITIGAHTMSHPILSRVDNERAKYEILESKIIIEEKVGTKVNFFAYPNGQLEDITPDVVDLVKQSGYRAAFTTIPGKNLVNSDFHRLNRIDITDSISTNHKGCFSPELFDSYLSGFFNIFH